MVVRHILPIIGAVSVMEVELVMVTALVPLMYPVPPPPPATTKCSAAAVAGYTLTSVPAEKVWAR